MIFFLISKLADDHPLPIVHVAEVADAIIQTEDSVFQVKTLGKFQVNEKWIELRDNFCLIPGHRIDLLL